MKYLVVHDTPRMASISIEPEGKIYIYPIKCWALTGGKAIMFANMEMANVFKAYFVSGTFQTKALYSMDFDEICAIITHKIGPDDEARYYALAGKQPAKAQSHKAEVVSEVVYHGAASIFTITGKLLKAAMFQVLVPFLIHMFSKRK